MYIHTYTYICIYAYVHARIHMYMPVQTLKYMYNIIHIHAFMCLYIYIDTRTHTCTKSRCAAWCSHAASLSDTCFEVAGQPATVTAGAIWAFHSPTTRPPPACSRS